MGNFLRAAVKAVRGTETITAAAVPQGAESNDAAPEDGPGVRHARVNEGFSGGEKKRAEMLQMAMLQPKIGDARRARLGPGHRRLRTVSEGINSDPRAAPEMGVLVITHYQRLLNYIEARDRARDGKGRSSSRADQSWSSSSSPRATTRCLRRRWPSGQRRQRRWPLSRRI